MSCTDLGSGACLQGRDLTPAVKTWPGVEDQHKTIASWVSPNLLTASTPPGSLRKPKRSLCPLCCTLRLCQSSRIVAAAPRNDVEGTRTCQASQCNLGAPDPRAWYKRQGWCMAGCSRCRMNLHTKSLSICASRWMVATASSTTNAQICSCWEVLDSLVLQLGCLC